MRKREMFDVAMSWFLAAGLACLAPCAVGQQLFPSGIAVFADFVADYDEASVTNAQASSATIRETSGGVSIPGIFLHPKGAGDAVLAFDGVQVPVLDDDEVCFLVLNLGLRDGFDWDAEPHAPNGVRFSVAINGQVVLEESVAEHGWKPWAVDMTPWAGQEVTVAFHTNAILGNTSYDWAVFGEPLLVRMAPAKDIEKLPREAAGLAIVELACAELSHVVLSMGPHRVAASFEPGAYAIPFEFTDVSSPVLEVQSGEAAIARVMHGVYRPQVEITSTELSSPLVTVGRPFHIIQRLKNVGRGTYRGGGVRRLLSRDGGDLRALGASALEEMSLNALQPGEETTLSWRGLVADGPGDWRLDVGQPLDFHVFDEEPTPDYPRNEEQKVIVEGNGDLRAMVGNAWSRLWFVLDDVGHAYAAGEVWDGEVWRRVASLYPLARLALRHADGTLEELELRISNMHPLRSTWLCIYGTAESKRGREWPILLMAYAEADGPRIHIEVETIAPEDAEIAVFSMPQILAGDRAFGATKDMALFPGLEYLERGEESSSTRDLAPPLHDRRVPAPHKITTPLMAVQGDGALVALLWDANKEWASGFKHPAARFSSPGSGSDMEYTHMSLFAPSVGEFVRENSYEAEENPFPVKRGQRIHLESWLVLDHQSRYPDDSMVNGPHAGGLVLQSMQYWFDIFGVPGPGTPPRDWEEQKALSREAYLETVWHEDPPGWSHCYGWQSQPAVGHAVPLLLDLGAGVAPNVAAEIERRIDLVVQRALDELGPRNLWTSMGCHIVRGEFPFAYGYLPESLKGLKQDAFGQLDARRDGLWVWQPASENHRELGTPGDHTLGQAAAPAMRTLRAARLTGDPGLAAQALEAMKQIERYTVPRGAQMWECPMYQPDILASAYAVRAYCEAYRLTGDPAHLEHARYWAWTGLPFIYMWEIEGIPTMRYNVIAVKGSTFYTHSWLGRPVVWCGLVYGYALQDLAEFDTSFRWATIAEGILLSAMRQQYTSGPSKGCYPDAWDMVENRPVPADINPENILMNGFRLWGPSPELDFVRLERSEGPPVMLNSRAALVAYENRLDEGLVRFTLRDMYAPATHTVLAPVTEPESIRGAGAQAADSAELQNKQVGWLYDPELEAVILKHSAKGTDITCEIRW